MNAVCPGCQSKLRVANSLAGKRAKCSKCGAVLDIPAAPPREGEVPAEPSLPVPGAPIVPSPSPTAQQAPSPAEAGFGAREAQELRPPLLSEATPARMAEELARRGLGAVLVSFPRDATDIEHFEDASFEVANSPNLTDTDTRSILLRIGMAVARQAAKSIQPGPPPLPE